MDPRDPMARRVREDQVLRHLLEGTAPETGTHFFRALVRSVSEALDTAGAWVTEYLPQQRRLRSLAFWMNGAYVEDYEYDLAGTPCEPVIDSCARMLVPDNVQDAFPGDPDLPALKAESYLGVPLTGPEGELLGHLAAIDSKPMREEPQVVTVFEIFAARASAEYLRMRAEEGVRGREQQLSRLLETAMDAVLILERSLAISRANPAAERVFGCGSQGLAGRDLRDFLDVASVAELAVQVQHLDGRPEGDRQCWHPRTLDARRVDLEPFPAEATLSSFDSGGQRYYTLILRNVNDRLEDQRRIELLTDEAEFLRETIRDVPGANEILGRSPCMQGLMGSVTRVASTDATVLLLGETGTGKELVARSIHNLSERKQGPMVRVNCAAMPGTLIESELFGHEKGAFTGASSRREGRFALADGGTIFLDEIGELPLDLQAKLLRVLQEKEFEPLGSTKTRKVDVRVVAATNRDVAEMVTAGEFREDLFYRLNVFPLRIPPLRERGDDIVLLAQAFTERFSQRMGLRTRPIAGEDTWRLLAYEWPGNVRELQNVIERALILSTGERVALAAAMPDSVQTTAADAPATTQESSSRILRADEMQQIERANFIRALESKEWQVAGENGAAALLGIPASTLSSRLRALGIKRPR